MDFWHYQPEDGRGWYVYGGGGVTPDGRQVVPDPGVAIRRFTGAMVASPGLAPLFAPFFGNPSDGDPVDLGTGLLVMDKVDLVVSDVLPLTLQRTYRQNDTIARSFGIGATHLYDMFLVGTVLPYTYIDLILPSGTRVHYDRISPGTGYADAVYEHTSTPSAFLQSRITWNGSGWNLDLKDGGRITFRDGFLVSRPAQAAATSIRDRHGNTIVLTRNTAADLTRITSPHGRWIELTYDASHRVTQARDHIGRAVSYTYDANGRLWKVTDALGGITEYTYDASHRLLTITDPRGIGRREICEERAADGTTVARRAFGQGEQVSGANRYFAADHLGSITEVTDGTAALLVRYAFDELCEIQATLHRPIPHGLPELNDAEAARLRRVMGFAIGTIYTDLMMPTIERYPDLDPDRDDAAPGTPAVPTENARPTRAEFSQRLLRACELASERLERLRQIIEAQQGESAGAAFDQKSADAKRHLGDLIDFASGLAAGHR